MAEIKSTRLRSIGASSREALEVAVEALPHKIEIKEILPVGKGFLLFFTIPDSSNFKSQDAIE